MKNKISFFLPIIFLLFGCGNSDKGPTTGDFEKQFSVNLPAYYTLSSFEVEASENVGTKVEPLFKARFKATVKLKADTYELDRQEGQATFIKPLFQSGEKRDIYGIATARLSAGNWVMDFNLENNPIDAMGKPKDFFIAKNLIVVGSKEEADYLAEMRKKQEAIASTFKGHAKDLSPTTDGLVAYYPFKGNAKDESGNGNNGIIYGNPSWVSDRFGNESAALSFDGSREYVVVNQPNFKFGEVSQFTFSTWVKFHRIGRSSILFSGSGAPDNFVVSLGTYDGYLRFGAAKQQAAWSEAKYSLPHLEANIWYNIVGVYENQHIRLYLDSKEIANVHFEYPGTTEDTLPFSIGACYWDANHVDDFFNGAINDIRIYDRVLSNAEIRSLYE